MVGTGYIMDETTGEPQNYTMVNFTVDADYACTVFQSCKKVSFISQASLTSSIAFLDFLGSNGKLQSKSIITFNLDEDNEKALN